MGNLEFGYLTIVGAIGAAEALLGREREREERPPERFGECL